MDSPEARIAHAGLLVLGARGPADLDAAIDLLGRSVPDAADRGPGLWLLASALQTRFDLAGAPDDLDACIDRLEELADGEPEAELWLGLNLAGRHLCDGFGDDGDRAVYLLGRVLLVLDALPAEPASRVPWTLGRILFDRSEGRPGRDLDEAARLLDAAARLRPDEPALLHELCEVQSARWRHGDRSALDRLIDVARALDPLLTGTDRQANLARLGRALGDRHLATGAEADRDAAIAALAVGAASDTERLLLARLLFGRARAAGAADLDASLTLLGGLVHSGSLSRAERDAVRSIVSGRPAPRPDAAELRRRWADLPDGHPDGRPLLAELALALGGRDGPAPELREAVVVLDTALARLEPSDPLGPRLALSLALTLARLCRSGEGGLPYNAVVGAADRFPDGPETGAVRGLALLVRDRPGDEARALAELEPIAAEVPEHHPLHGPLAVVLGVRTARRAAAGGDLRWADAADRHLGTALRYDLDDRGLRTLHALNRTRLARASYRLDLAERAISALESNLAAMSSTDSWYPRTTRALGEAWCVRGVLRGSESDQVRGGKLVIAAYDAAPLTHPDLAELRAAAALARSVLAGPRALEAGPVRDGHPGWREA